MKLSCKLAIEFFPLAAFFVAIQGADVYVGTAVMMVATVVSMSAVWMLWRQLALMALITAGTSLLFGALTLYWTDPVFVKLKPTIVSLLFAGILACGLLFHKPLLRPLLGDDLNLTPEGWHAITWRWTLYFVFVAFTNEIVWRSADAIWRDDAASAVRVWASFKLFGLTPMTLAFALCQLPLLRQHRLSQAQEAMRTGVNRS